MLGSKIVSSQNFLKFIGCFIVDKVLRLRYIYDSESHSAVHCIKNLTKEFFYGPFMYYVRTERGQNLPTPLSTILSMSKKHPPTFNAGVGYYSHFVEKIMIFRCMKFSSLSLLTTCLYKTSSIVTIITFCEFYWLCKKFKNLQKQKFFGSNEGQRWSESY